METRRDFLERAGAAAVAWPPIAAFAAQNPPSFHPVPEPLPPSADMMPAVPAAAPAGTTAMVYDAYGNYWALAPKGNRSALMVLAAQQPDAWQQESASGLKPGPWKFLAGDEHGALWVASAQEVLRLDLLYPSRGWQNISADTSFPRGEITALAASPSGSMLAALTSGRIVEMDRVEQRQDRQVWQENIIRSEPAPVGIHEIRTDADGRTWAAAREKVYRKDAPLDAWQRSWILAARMPGCNHDLSGDVMDGRFYMAGGVAAGWGYPPAHHFFEEVFEFDPESSKWRAAARLGMGRGYNATTFLNGEIWVIAGDVELTGGRRLAVGTVQICDPRSGMVRRGPELPAALPMPLAVHLGGRIYVAGSPKDRYTDPGMLFSIGAGESVWRREPDGPTGMSALAGTPHQGKFYILVPHRSLAVFDPAKGAWTEVEPPNKPRSSQVAVYQAEIWVMGGIGTRGHRETQIYSPQTDRWRPGPDIPRPLSWGVAANVNGRLMLTGGDGGRCYSNRTFYLRKDWQH